MKSIERVVAQVLTYYNQNGRDLPWRLPDPNGNFDPYKITVSEIMLQQTQVSRVWPKYESFLKQFPDVNSLAKAALSDVMVQWQGLGYNRRAKYLHQTAKSVVEKYGGVFPKSQDELSTLPGIGFNTAGAIYVYAFNEPALFIETNIRTVFIHHFFQDKDNVADKDILPLLQQSLEGQDPRSFYWALMDYGTYIKTQFGNSSARSKHYVKQPRFEGSHRQLRGSVLRTLADGSMTPERLRSLIPDARLDYVIEDLTGEGLIEETPNGFRLAH